MQCPPPSANFKVLNDPDDGTYVGVARLSGLRRACAESALVSGNQILWVGSTDRPPCAAGLSDMCEIVPARLGDALNGQLSASGVAVVCPNGQGHDAAGARRLLALLDELDRTSAVAVFVLDPQAHAARAILDSRQGQFICLGTDATPAELAAAVAAARALQPTIRSLRRELGEARAIHNIPVPPKEVDEEMRLAARLQRDFLPRRLPEVGGIRFGVLYRPASWVSGDIYDVARLDETHVGFYVADVVGHGMPAALLTMFIKKALVTKRIVGNTYEIVPPHVSLGELNRDICQQNLSACHFCTALYCVLDTQSLMLTYCRGGHPEPILIRPDGVTHRPSSTGALLGVFEDEEFTASTLQLSPGDRLMLYTDGVEDALRTPASEEDPLERMIHPWLRLPREEMLLRLTAGIDANSGKHRPADDVTVMVVDVTA